jgi:hypothetical protein
MSATGAPNRGTLPPVDDLEHEGPFMVGMMDNTGPGRNYRLIYPMPLGKDGIKHPVFSWGPGAGSTPDVYVTALAHVASHGFVVLSYNATPQGKELTDAIGWLVEQNQASSGMLSGKLDTEHVAVGGHSAGSLATFVVASDPRITTTVHMSGGTFDPHTDVKNLRAPAVFLCGRSPMGSDDGLTTGDLADPNCKIDFMNATGPVFYGSLKDGAHVSLIDVAGIGPSADDPTKLKFIGAMVGWLRWKLAGDESLKSMFVGTDCTLCKPDTGWTVQQKNLM